MKHLARNTARTKIERGEYRTETLRLLQTILGTSKDASDGRGELKNALQRVLFIQYLVSVRGAAVRSFDGNLLFVFNPGHIIES